MTQQTLERADGDIREDVPTTEKQDELHEEDRLAEPIDKQYVNDRGPLSHYREATWFKPAVGFASGIVIIILLSILL